MGVQTISGVFAERETGGSVFRDAPTLIQGGQRLSGGVRTVQANIQPTLMETWTILGWTMNIFFGWNRAGGFNGPYWGQLGQIWAGLQVDGFLREAGGGSGGGFSLPGGAAFPTDMSTFTKAWDADSDPTPANVENAAGGTTVGFTVVPAIFQLPFPLLLRSGARLQMVLIRTPPVVGSVIAAGGMPGIEIRAAQYTISYDTAVRG